MRFRDRVWPVVLAGGDGRRLRALTTDRQGVAVPKQFCSLIGDTSLLQLALRRASLLAPWNRITAVVAADHERWWRSELSRLSRSNVIVQPLNRGTATGVLLPLLHVSERDPEASVVLLPSDHYVADEAELARSVRTALAGIARAPDRVMLLGIVPDAPEPDFGWIVPAEPHGVQGVARFVEKPTADVARGLMRQGGLWNSFVVVARARTMLQLFECKLPGLQAAVGAATARGAGELRQVYERLESHDFCRDLLEGSEERLLAVPVPPCGWNDLGTPDRVLSCLDRLDPVRPAAGERVRPAPVALASSAPGDAGPFIRGTSRL